MRNRRWLSAFSEIARNNRQWAFAILYCDVMPTGIDKIAKRLKIKRGGNTDRIVALLEGNAPMTRGARLLLADLLRRSSLMPKQGRPPRPLYDEMTPKQLGVAYAAEMVRILRAEGFNRDEAIREVVASGKRKTSPPVTENELRNALRRGLRLPR